MPKKKTPANAFYFFMLDRKASYERNGERFPNGLKDVSEVAGPEWAVLPASERKKYEDMAKEEKARQKGNIAGKYTNAHNSFAYLEKSKRQEEDAKQKMNEDIEETICLQLSTNKIAEFKFFLIHVNYFCITEGECYIPAELAVSEFSLGEGVTDVFHSILNAGKIPLGYRHDAMQRSQSVHQIPIEPEDGEKQFSVVWKKIKDILEHGRSAHGGQYPPMYTMPDNVNLNTSISCVKSVVQMLCESVGDNPDDFLIYPLEKLCFELKNGCADMSGLGKDDPGVYWPSIPFANSKLEDDTYNYTPHIACSFHYNEDQVVNCSKSFVQRWAYLICDECCQYLNIKLIPGRHVPLHSDVNYKQQHEQREQEKNAEAAAAAAAKVAPKPFTFVDHSAGKTTFIPVEPQCKPLPQPKIQPSVPRPVASHVYSNIDTSEENFPAITIGRGRGRVPPRGGGGRGSGPMSFAAAMQSKK